MNLKYPNFNFDDWCLEINYLFDNLKLSAKDFGNDLTFSIYQEQFQEKKESFYNQQHDVFNEFEDFDQCKEYLNYLFYFNKFMSFLHDCNFILHSTDIFEYFRFEMGSSMEEIEKHLDNIKNTLIRLNISNDI